MSRYAKALLSAIDPRVYLHGLRILHFYGYAHVSQVRKLDRAPGATFAPNVSFRNAERITIGSRNPHRRVLDDLGGNSVGRITFGEKCLLAPRVTVTASNYGIEQGTPVMDQPKIESDIVIGSGMLARRRCRRAGRCHDRSRRDRRRRRGRHQGRARERDRRRACRRRSSARGRSQSASLVDGWSCMTPTVDVIIVNYNTRDRTLECIASVLRAAPPRSSGGRWWTTARPTAASRRSRRRTPRSFSSMSARTSGSRGA